MPINTERDIKPASHFLMAEMAEGKYLQITAILCKRLVMIATSVIMIMLSEF